ncbi:hypothetical protein N015_13090 [Pseudomonas asturiensis]|uniref:Uncharacterized protein n=1 Tax=Pseudomonas asturiensis TaxID=1190415 RepID=A0ABX6HCK3_9PSED|nr:hypothetical protein [Pseudomonas asturiensis]QHF03290.1 hypothetical protein N015_13090 [Pseudomonas asturiensis]
MSNDKMRDEFEVWARKMSMDLEYRNIPGVGQFYECPRTLLALEAWKASREALVIELPNRFSEAYQDYFDDVEGGCFNESKYINDLQKNIEAAGVRMT